MITLTNLEKKYEQNLFYAISYQFNPGNIYLLTGDMGTGKSTVLKLILGLEKPSAGKIDHQYCPAEFMYNEPWQYIYSSVSVNANLRFYQELFDCSKEYYKTIFETFKLEDINKIKVSKLSDGNKKKVSLACSFLNDKAKVLLLDEPLVNLDKTSIIDIIRFLEQIKKDKIIIIISHQYNDIEAYVDIHLELKNKVLKERN